MGRYGVGVWLVVLAMEVSEGWRVVLSTLLGGLQLME